MIAIEGIAKCFHRGSINEVLAIDGIDLTIDTGEFITVIGSNGAGKSSLLNCLAGTYPLDAGRLIMDGTDITNWPEHRRAKFIGRVFQNPLLGTCTNGSIAQNLSLAAKRGQRRGLGWGVKRSYRHRFREELRTIGLGLEDRLEDRVGLLSGGQRQALTMLMATLVHPDLLLLDEHTAALDPKTARQILGLTRTIVEENNLTTLMVTHNMKQALALGNRLVMLHRGRVIYDVSGSDKEKLTVNDLLARFYDVQGEELATDRILMA
jgi:putative ABC transport system ATP-binding protein